MTPMKSFAHIAIVSALLLTFVGGTMALSGNFNTVRAALFGGSADLVSSASTIQAAPDGTYTIFINAKLHKDPKVLNDWVTFFTGAEDAPLIMEDVSAVVARGDAGGKEMAESLQSRLAEHQMTLRDEEGPFALSKALAGMFDVLIMSDGAAALYSAELLNDRPDVVVIHR